MYLSPVGFGEKPPGVQLARVPQNSNKKRLLLLRACFTVCPFVRDRRRRRICTNIPEK